MILTRGDIFGILDRQPRSKVPELGRGEGYRERAGEERIQLSPVDNFCHTIPIPLFIVVVPFTFNVYPPTMETKTEEETEVKDEQEEKVTANLTIIVAGSSWSTRGP